MLAFIYRETLGGFGPPIFRRRRALALALVALGVAESAAAESPLGALGEVARIFDYPVKKMVAKDLTENFRIRYGDDLVSAYEYSSCDNTFAPITVTVARQGVLFTPELKVSLKGTLQADAAGGGNGPRKLRSVALGGGGEGFAGINGFGSSEERWHLVLTLPQRHLDLHISAAAAPTAAGLDIAPGTTRYYELACAGGDRWWTALAEVGRQGVGALLRESPVVAPRVDPPAQTMGNFGGNEMLFLGESTLASFQALRIALEGGPSRWLLMGTFGWLIIGVLAARIGLYSK